MIRGWCPTVHEPMPTGDGLLARVKPPGGRLSTDAARRITASAVAQGNGIVELTRRGNLQVRGLAPEGVAPFAAAMVEAGLAHPDAAAERRRNVLASPLAGDDPDVAVEVIAIAASIEAMLEDGTGLERLSPKFGVVMDGGGALPLGSVAADVNLRLNTSEVVSIETITALVRQRAIDAGDQRIRGSVNPPTQPIEPVGFHRYRDSPRGAFGIGLPFGQTDAAGLAALGALAERFGDGILRLSPWRTVLLGSVRADHALNIAAKASDLGLIADARDPRLRAFACVGSAGCVSGTVPARADAGRLAAAGFEGTLHVSGCAKGCAHPGPATVTMVGEAGRYRIVRNGRVPAL